MNHDFRWIEGIEEGRLSLVGIIRANRWMNDSIPKRKRGFKIALAALVTATAALYIVFGISMGKSSRDTKLFAALLLAAITLIYMFMLLILRYVYINKPARRYKKALETGYPGLDASSEGSIKSHVWSMEGDPHVMLYNLCQLILWEGEARALQGTPPNEVYSPAERIVLDVCRTNDIEKELVDLYRGHEHELAYLEGAIDSFKAIGADAEASVWAEARAVFEGLEASDGEAQGEKAFALSYDGETLYRFTEGMKNRVFDLKAKIAECRDDTEMKLCRYVAQHRSEFVFK